MFSRLLLLAQHPALPSLLEEALELIAEATGARLVFLELHDEADDRLWVRARGVEAGEQEAVKHLVSRGILSRALAEGRLIQTPSALLDPRFSGNPSVRRNGVDAVLCAPVHAHPISGALYLQGCPQPGPFTDDDVGLVQLFCDHVGPIVRQVVSLQGDRKGSAEGRHGLNLQGVLGRSPAVRHLIEELAVVAPRRITVLLSGPTGSGKTLVARAVHENGPRAGQPFVELNCATLPDELAESELFGAVAGAHSTARREIPGKVAAADGGTLFLDEVGTLSLRVQAKLLQFLQSRRFYRLGSNRESKADVRILAATNEDLLRSVEDGRFREDLYYRPGPAMTVRVPALSERRADIPLLAGHFLHELCVEEGEPELPLLPPHRCSDFSTPSGPGTSDS